VFNDAGSDPYWLYSNNEGFIKRVEGFDERDIVTKMGNLYGVEQVCAVLKTADMGSYGKVKGNCTQLLSSKTLSDRLLGLSSNIGGETMVY